MEDEIDNPVVQHLDSLAKELSCSICLSVMETPVARLPCCHYFCHECITESVRHKPACPVCKTRASRRDIADDTTMDRVVQAFKTLQEHKTGMAAAFVAARARPANPANGNEEDVDAIPWLRGVENHEFQSPSKSLSGTQLERMRGRQSERSPSPATVQKGAAPRQAEPASPTSKVKPTKGRSSSKKQQQQSDASGSKSAGAKRAPPPGTQSIQKFLQKKTATPEEIEMEQQGDTGAKDSTAMQDHAVPQAAQVIIPQTASPSSQLGDDDQTTMAQQLDAIVAGLDSCDEPEPMEAAAAEETANATAAAKPVVERGITKTPLAPAAAALRNASTAKPQQRKRSGGSSTGGGDKDKDGGEIATLPTKRGRKRSAESPAEIMATKDGTDGGDDGGSAKRRIPTRLLPWNCPTCTFENKGGEHKCEMCQNLRIGGPNTTNGGGVATTGNTTGGNATGGKSTTARRTGTGNSTPAAIPAAQQDPDTATPVARAGSKAGGSGGGGSGRRGAAGSLQRRAQTQAQAQAQAAPATNDVSVQKKQPKLTARKGKAPGAQTAPQRSRLGQVGGADTQIIAPSANENTNNNTTTTSVVTWTGGKVFWVLLGSGLDSEGKAKLRALASASGSTVVDKWSPKVTHVVCGGATPDRTARRTFKYLMGVLTGRWVVGEGWVSACLGAGKAAKEVDFEIEVDSMGCAGGPSRGRAARAACESKHAKHAHDNNGSNEALLKGYEVQLVGEFGCKTQVVDLVKAAGGKVTARLPTKGASGGGPGGVVLVEVPDTSPAAAQGFKAAVAEEAWFARAVGAEVPVVSHRWLTDSISKLELCPMQEFAV